MTDEAARTPHHFIQEIIEADNAARKWGAWPDGRPKVHTRFPPEPNGYLHIGHAKSICLNYGLAAQYGGLFNLRFDDTNPCKEEQEYVDSIVADVRWLGAKWVGMREDDREAGVIFSSDYFQKMHDWAVLLIRKGKAYVCDLSAEETSQHRGTLTRPGKNSPYRDRSVAENMDLFERMRKGEFPDGSRTLKAKIDMAHANLNLRDPVMYRILHAEHHRTGDAWCIYPMYDWAHGLEDSIEGITHSICTLEFENHRPLYDWFIDAINEGNPQPIHHPQQIEFARLALTYTVMSKRKFLELVKGDVAQVSTLDTDSVSRVSNLCPIRGWDDPRMPTISGLRRRGYPPEAIRNFCADIGVAKFNSVIEVVRLENAARDYLNKIAPRRMAVLRPLKLVITNWPAGGQQGSALLADEQSSRRGGQGSALSADEQSSGRKGQGSALSDSKAHVDYLDAVNNPEDTSAGTRKVPFSRVLYIERDDFREDPPKGYFRLFPGNEVRLRYAYYVKCTGCVKDPATGEVVEVHCTYDPSTRGGDSPDKRKVKGTIHWVSAAHAIDAEVRLYDHLYKVENPEVEDQSRPEQSRDREGVPGNAALPTAGPDWKSNLNPDSLQILRGCKLEPSLSDAECRRDSHGTLAPDRFQFERHGYFCVDPDWKPRALVFNRTVSLKDSWAKVEKKK